MGVAMIGSTKCAASAGLPVKRAASKAVIGERFSEQVLKLLIGHILGEDFLVWNYRDWHGAVMR
jgi:hypothetical protein